MVFDKLNVLLMDDDYQVRLVSQKLFEHLGCHAKVVEDGAKAVSEFKQAYESGESYDLVILDYHVDKGIGGKKAFAQLREIDPNAVVFVSSGYSDDLARGKYTDLGFTGFLAKPFSLDSLRELLVEHEKKA